MPSRLAGSKLPLRSRRSRRRTYARDSGEMLVMFSSVSCCRENGAGDRGRGCVGQASSPGMSNGGTPCSSIGKSGSPVSRSNTNTWADFVVMNRLEMPDPLPRSRIQREERVGKEVLAVAVGAVEVARGRPRGT